MPRRFKVGEEIYNIPEDRVNEFLVDVPGAKEVRAFVVDKDTFNIPLDKVDEFKKDVPDAKPLYEEKGFFEKLMEGAKTYPPSGASCAILF